MNKILFFLILTLFFSGKTLIANLDVQDIANKIIADPSDAGVILFESDIEEKDVLSELKILLKKRFPLKVRPNLKEFKKLELSDDKYITGLCFYPDGGVLAISDNEGFICIYNFCVNEFRILQVLETGSKIERLEMSADGRFLISSNNNKVTIWKFNNCEYCKVQELDFCFGDMSKDFCLSADGKILIVAGFYEKELCFFKRKGDLYSRIKALKLGLSSSISNLCTSYNGNMTICAYQNTDFISLYFYECLDKSYKFRTINIPDMPLSALYIPGFRMDFYLMGDLSISFYNLVYVELKIDLEHTYRLTLPAVKQPAFFESISDWRFVFFGYYSGEIRILWNLLTEDVRYQNINTELIPQCVEHKFFGCASSDNYEKCYIAVGCGKRVKIYKEYSVIDELSFDQMIAFLMQRCS